MARGRSHASSQPGLTAGLRFFCAALALALPAVSGLSAHDFWIEPSDFAPAPGAAVGLGLWSGDHFSGTPVPRNAGRLTRFAVLAGGGEQPIDGAEGVHPAGFFKPPAPGPYWVVLETRPRRLVLAAEAFENYLREEGLERIVALRGARSESAAAGREAYRRCAKTLLEAGGPGDAPGAGAAGCPLELVLGASPRAAAAAGALPVRLLFRGRPLAGARVAVLRRSAPRAAFEARTDAAGEASFPVAAGDVWLVKAVHMEAAAPQQSDVDWQSWWASLTLRLPDPGPPPAR